MKDLFELKDIEPQLNEEQIEFVKNTIFMSKELKEPQKVTVGIEARPIVIWPSGKMHFFDITERRNKEYFELVDEVKDLPYSEQLKMLQKAGFVKQK